MIVDEQISGKLEPDTAADFIKPELDLKENSISCTGCGYGIHEKFILKVRKGTDQRVRSYVLTPPLIDMVDKDLKLILLIVDRQKNDTTNFPFLFPKNFSLRVFGKCGSTDLQ